LSCGFLAYFELKIIEVVSEKNVFILDAAFMILKSAAQAGGGAVYSKV
jgi:hypothetical protein